MRYRPLQIDVTKLIDDVITATCYQRVTLQLHPVQISRSCRWHRMHWPESFAKLREHAMPQNCAVHYTGYQWNNASTTKLAVLTYKARQSGSPSYLASLISDYAPSRSLRSSDKQLLSRPYTSLVIANKALSVSSPKIWNDLTFNSRAATCVNSFKRIVTLNANFSPERMLITPSNSRLSHLRFRFFGLD